MAISVQNVCKRFGDFVALEDVGLDVPDGSLTALLGPSGSGKSTLLRVIAGLEKADSGEVFIGDIHATPLPAHRRDVGFVFQHYAAFKHMAVENTKISHSGTGLGIPGTSAQRSLKERYSRSRRYALVRTVARIIPR